MARFLVDEDCPKAIAQLLQARGLAAVHVQDAGLAGYKDADLFEWAQRE
jgi:predicted nuclease of predicted toxin-antitoxin system